MPESSIDQVSSRDAGGDEPRPESEVTTGPNRFGYDPSLWPTT